MPRRAMVALLALLTAGVAAWGQETPSPSLAERVTLPKLTELALAHNPGIQAAKARWGATIERLPQARALPDPVLAFDYYAETVETRVGPQEYRVGLSQRFPFPGTLDAAADVVGEEARRQYVLYQQAVRDLVIDLRVSYHELLYLRGAAAITRQNQALLQHIVRVTNNRYANGEAQLRDLLSAQSQLAQLGYDVVLLEELQEVEEAKLLALLDLPPETDLGEVEAPPLRLTTATLEEVQAAALDGRQELAAADLAIDKRAAAIRHAKLQNLPSFSLSASRIETGEAEMDIDESGKDPWMIGVGITIPLWFDRNRSRVREAELEHQASLASRRQLENTTRAELRSAWFELRNARRLIELYDQSLLPQARQAMAIAEQWNDDQTGRVGGFLETQSVWLNFNLARLRAVSDYQQALANLERLVGGPLPEVAPLPEPEVTP